MRLILASLYTVFSIQPKVHTCAHSSNKTPGGLPGPGCARGAVVGGGELARRPEVGVLPPFLPPPFLPSSVRSHIVDILNSTREEKRSKK